MGNGVKRMKHHGNVTKINGAEVEPENSKSKEDNPLCMKKSHKN
jgi:hypothetical protein